MKIFSLVLLSITAFPLYASSFWDAIQQNQNTLPAPATSTQATQSQTATSSSVQASVDNATCEENSSKQDTLPLSYLSRLIRLPYQQAKLNINHDPASGRLRITAPAPIIGNCASMLKFNLNQNEINGAKTYAVSVNFKDENCSSSGEPAVKKCRYRVSKVVNENTTYEEMEFEPTLLGFQACMEATGVMAGGQFNGRAVDPKSLDESFSGLDESGQLLFLSRGKVSASMADNDFKFSKVRQNGCDVYEKIDPNIAMVYSPADLETQRRTAEADTLRNCTPGEYQRLVDFIERNGNVSDLNAIRDNLIKQAAQALAKKIADNKELNDEDMKVIADFERYIIEPLRAQIADKYNQIESLPDSEKPAARAELTAMRNQLLAYGRAPYFQRAQVEKLISLGRFDDAEKMEGLRITITEAGKIGTGNPTVTPDQARVAAATARGNLQNNMSTERENWDIRHGTITDRSATYRNLAQSMRNNIQRRTQNYTQEIQSEYARIQQPNGYCFRYFRNTQKCMQDSLQRIQELQTALTHYNQIDQQRAAQYDQQATDYSRMEQEGRRNRAIAQGEEPPAEAPVDTTAVPARTDQQDPAAAAAAMMPQGMMNPMQPYSNPMMQMQMNPYANMYGQSQNPLMGQAGFNAGFGYQGTMGTNFMGMQQPQYGSVGMNWMAMGQQMGQGMMGQPMFGQQSMYPQMGMPGMSMQSPYGQMYGQSPYLMNGMSGMSGMGQNGLMGGQMGMGMGGMGMGSMMPQAYNYPRFF